MKVTRILDAIQSFTTDHREALDQIGETVILKRIQQTFREEGTPRWAPLAPRTLEERRKKGFGPGPILQRTGELMREASSKASQHMAYILKPRELTISLDPTFEKFQHQFGWSGVPFIPARPFFYVTVQDEERAMDVLALALTKRVQAAL